MKVERYQAQSCSTPDPRCGKQSPLAAQADPGGDPSLVYGPRSIWFRRLRPTVTYCDEIRPGWAYRPSWPEEDSVSGTTVAPVSLPVSQRLRNCCCASGVLHTRPGLLPSVILRDGSGLHSRPVATEETRLHCWWAV